MMQIMVLFMVFPVFFLMRVIAPGGGMKIQPDFASCASVARSWESGAHATIGSLHSTRRPVFPKALPKRYFYGSIERAACMRAGIVYPEFTYENVRRNTV
jgi:hypothetical protein